MQGKKAITAYFSGEHLLPFDFAEQNRSLKGLCCIVLLRWINVFRDMVFCSIRQAVMLGQRQTALWQLAVFTVVCHSAGPRLWHNVVLMLPTVYDAGPTSEQHCANVSCLLRYTLF